MSYARTFRNETVRICTIADTGFISDTHFQECIIVGPAVLAIMDASTALVHNAFEANNMDEIFWEVPQSRQIVRGAIGLTNCRIENCRLAGIGIAGRAELGQQFGLRPAASGIHAKDQQIPSPAPNISFMSVSDSNLTGANIEHNLMEVHYGTLLSQEEGLRVASLLRELRGALAGSGLGKADIQEIDSQLTAAEAEVGSSQPRRQVIRQALTRVAQTIQSTSEFATASAALVEIVNKLHQLLPVI
jgi:hypothetical protein